MREPKPHVPVVFTYEHRYRRVDVERVWRSKEGHILLTGWDLDRDEYRSFRVDRIKGKIRRLGKGDHENLFEVPTYPER